MSEYTLNHVVVNINSSRGIHLLQSGYKCSHVLIYINSLKINSLLLFHVTKYLFMALFTLIFDCKFDLCCRLLIRLMLLILFACV